MEWPQIVMIVWLTMVMMASIYKHGRQVTITIWNGIAVNALVITCLIAGGFFR